MRDAVDERCQQEARDAEKQTTGIEGIEPREQLPSVRCVRSPTFRPAARNQPTRGPRPGDLPCAARSAVATAVGCDGPRTSCPALTSPRRRGWLGITRSPGRLPRLGRPWLGWLRRFHRSRFLLLPERRQVHNLSFFLLSLHELSFLTGATGIGFQRSIGFATPFGRNGSATLHPWPAAAYAAYRTSCTTRPVSPSEIGVSLPRTHRAKCRISCGKP